MSTASHPQLALDTPAERLSLVRGPAPGHRLVLALFTATLFGNALLVFLVQPMFSKMVLPLLGGTPAVWNTCMLFFQGALLAGYLYAHASARWLPLRAQAVAHVALLAAAVAALPLAVPAGWTPPTAETPTGWLILLLTVSLGAPFVLLSAGAPLLQHWFSRTSHPDAHNPYFLYAASNLGSMAALLGYPLVVEPRLRLAGQSWAWTVGYVALVVLIAACARAVWRAGASPRARRPAADLGQVRTSARPLPPEAGGVTLEQRVRWVVLAFVPSSLLLGVTTFLTTDVAAVPLFWVVPLALYLLTFVIAFARRPVVPHRSALLAQSYAVLLLVVLLFWGGALPALIGFPLHLIAFALTALVCHGELARRQPAARALTEFYLWIAVGGVLGGIFNVLVAPTMFSSVLEYPIALTLACLLRPALAPGRRLLDWVLPAVLGALCAAMFAAAPSNAFGPRSPGFFLLSCLVAVALLSFRDRPIRLGLGVAAVLLVGGIRGSLLRSSLLAERSFFGVYSVRDEDAGRFRVFYSGTTNHGAQSLDPARRREPTTYYSREGPLGPVFAAPPGAPPRRVAVVGLGVASTAAYARPGERFTFYEIDPLVVRIARDPRYFTFLQDARGEVDVVLGDARLSLQRAAAHEFDVVVLDAFSSDAIPVHLITREALALYLTKLNERGVLAVHISNRHLDLRPVLAALARDAGLVGLTRSDGGQRAGRSGALDLARSASVWAVLARRPADVAALSTDPAWKPLPASGPEHLWTDDFSNILSVYKR